MTSHAENFDHTGSTFDSFLEEENLLNEALAVAQKRVIAWQIKQGMSRRQMTTVELAQHLHTSRSQIRRLLDPEYIGVSFSNITKALHAIGKQLRVEVVDAPKPKTSNLLRARRKAVGK